jgi:hypothetical protein
MKSISISRLDFEKKVSSKLHFYFDKIKENAENQFSLEYFKKMFKLIENIGEII